MGKRYEYEVRYGGYRYLTKAGSASEAKRHAAHQHRNRLKDWDKRIEDIMKRMTVKRV